MKIETNGNKKLPFLEFIFIIYLFALYLLPAVSMGSTTLLLLLVVYCGYMVFVDKTMFPVVAKTVLLILALAFFYALLTEGASIAQNVSNRELKRFISKTYQYLTLYFPAILFVRLHKTATVKQKRWLAAIGAVLMVYVIVTTWIFLQENPDATREWENFEENSTQGVADYAFIYAVPILLAVIAVFMSNSKGIMKWIALVLLLVGILFLVSAQYTLAIMIAVIGVLLQVLRNMRSPVGKVLFGFGILVAALCLPQILMLAIQNIPSEQITTRLTEVHAFLTGKGMDSHNLGGRMSLYGRTLEAFFKSPIWGNRRLSFDGHATFLTVLSDTGILGGSVFYILLATVCKIIKKQMGKCRKQYDLIIIMFVLMGLVNPIHASMPLGIATWLLAPLSIQLMIKEDPIDEKALEN